MSGNQSCLVAKLSNYAEIDRSDRELLARFEENSVSKAAGSYLYRGGHEIQNMYVVKRGWLLSSTTLVDGRQQVTRIHYPGDIIGVSHLPFDHAIVDVVAVEDAELCPFPKSHLDKVMVESPRLTALLMTFALVESSTYVDRIRTLGRMNAGERIMHLLLEIASRLRVTGALGDGNSFRLPLTQKMIGDAVGLTNVYVSKSLSRLESDGHISREGSTFAIPDWERSVEFADFHNRFESMDTSWFPARR